MATARPTLGGVLLPLVLATPLGAAPPARTHDITVDDYFTIAVITACAASPDGAWAAYLEMRWEPDAETRNTDLWLVPASGGERRRLTFDAAGEASPQWSPDGNHLYFNAGYQRGGEDKPPYNGKPQVWRIAPEGGEPQAVTRLKDGVGAYQLAHGGRRLYYTTSSEQIDDDFKELRSRFTEIEYGHGVNNVTQLWVLDLESWRSEKLIDEKRVIREFDVAPDESHVAMLTTPTEHLISNEGQSRVDLWSAATRKVATLPDKLWRADAPSPYGWLDSVVWSDDGNALAFSISFDGYPPRLFVAERTGADFVPRRVTLPDEITLTGGTMRFRPGTRDLCFLGEQRARSRLYCLESARVDAPAACRELTPGDVVVHAYSFPREGGEPLVVASTPTHPPDLFRLAVRPGEMQRLTTINPQVDTWKLPQLSLVQWKAPDGTAVEGVLELPPDHKPGAPPLPLVVEIHGGPTACTPFCLQYWIYGRTLLPAKGYALLSPNYRGSTGYGEKFMLDLIGRENDVEVKDILAGVDAMIERGIADPQRLGVMGWSNGGFLTNCLIITTDRFKAASSGAGVLDQFMQWGTEDTPGHVINYMKGLPWSQPEAYRSASPSARLDRVRTPTLIHVGANDARVPASHARTLYRALREYLNVPTELLVYPGEGHGLTKYRNRQAKMEWDLAWFNRHLLGKSDESRPKGPID